jgi:hypothetical protein
MTSGGRSSNPKSPALHESCPVREAAPALPLLFPREQEPSVPLCAGGAVARVESVVVEVEPEAAARWNRRRRRINGRGVVGGCGGAEPAAAVANRWPR